MVMKNSVSLFDAIEDQTVVGSDSFLDQIVVWNGSSTFNVFYYWGKDQWECIDSFTNYGAMTTSAARDIARDYLVRVCEEAAESTLEYDDRS
jgi:hypothetical protein